MDMKTKEKASENIILVGPMACGKTTVGRALAAALDMPFVDTDALIEAETGQTVAQVFAVEGEFGFRRREREVVARAASLRNTVVAVGGGTLLDPVNRRILKQSGALIGLKATPEVIFQRVWSQENIHVARPLFAGVSTREERMARIRALLNERLPGLAECDFVLDTSALSVAECVSAIIGAVTNGRKKQGHKQGQPQQEPFAVVNVSTASGGGYPVLIGEGLRHGCGRLLREAVAGLPERLFVVTNETVHALYGIEVEQSLRGAGFAVSVTVLPDGEQYKTLETAGKLYERMAGEGMTRRGTAVVALGGGVIGDLAGFVAATYGRGVPLVQMPTTLLAQVDASIGGKVAVNLPSGKNLIGAFHQPVAVIMDTQMLSSLPEREFAEGLAEVVKYGVILDEGFLRFLEDNRFAVAARNREVLNEVLLHSCRLKAMVVRDDEKDDGARMVLNFGHTVGHAVEAVEGYGALRHGEAVSIGMCVAMRLALQRGLMSEAQVRRVEKLLGDFGLPLEANGSTFDSMLPFLALDKKTVGGRLRFILPRGLGEHIVVDDISLEALRSAWDSIRGIPATSEHNGGAQ